MSKSWIYTYLEKLISNSYYKTKEEVLQKLQMFAMFDDITGDEYMELRTLAEEKYQEVA
jgi:hypothetical protein